MIQPNELRIGNWVWYHDRYLKIDPNHLSLMWTGRFTFEPKPIPLNSYVIEKAGFKKRQTKLHTFYHLLNVKIEQYVNGRFGYIYSSKVKDIHHLHQLQNLFFALTDAELEIEF